ncbi:hypothetical protein RCZ15_20550 [Capnocytophaga catalasegens]|uniref:Uncharacterized protein n=1 Tax=Capnocytophaga catalasegens TaxID=1004260 RepID=A0AAV5B0U7_9FLAO|nr:hypothetical protein RCZ03_14940 [Capnocytophaga catalasegens]GJM51082.1 hypothetical protein RCZ15_20550 [Capnocytophaga catalasegens]GJM52267.1 hypothetical protein RCZ16_05850 [Capnocytophaga catalasegens]
MKNIHKILLIKDLGMKANNKIVSVVKIVIECPEGKLEKPTAVLPIIENVSLSYMVAGLGISKNSFKLLENKRDSKEAESKASHIFGIYIIKIVINDKIIRASPSWVKLCCKLGNCDNFELIKKK